MESTDDKQFKDEFLDLCQSMNEVKTYIHRINNLNLSEEDSMSFSQEVTDFINYLDKV